MQTHYLIVLKFGTQQDSVSVHCGINFGSNNLNGHKDICNYSRKITAPMANLFSIYCMLQYHE